MARERYLELSDGNGTLVSTVCRRKDAVSDHSVQFAKFCFFIGNYKENSTFQSGQGTAFCLKTVTLIYIKFPPN